MTNHSAPLLQATVAIFEELALLAPAGPLPCAPDLPLDYGVRVAFDGARSGALELRATGELARAAAANMLGVHAAPPALARDALGEVANVLCGNVLPLIVPGGCEFRLQAPELVSVARPVQEAQATCVRVALDRGCVEARLVLSPMAEAP
jgi:hypothetical protein